jgi:hypothetical protein
VTAMPVVPTAWQLLVRPATSPRVPSVNHPIGRAIILSIGSTVAYRLPTLGGSTSNPGKGHLQYQSATRPGSPLRLGRMRRTSLSPLTCRTAVRTTRECTRLKELHLSQYEIEKLMVSLAAMTARDRLGMG